MSRSTSEVDRDDAQATELTTDERHRILASERRRAVLDALATGSGSTTLSALAAAVDAAENDLDRAAATARDEIRVDLHHVHLPMLADAGLVDYDVETKRVDRAVPAAAVPTA
ncbi:DUF7344 domain-containing protein [Halosimplex salinum]|uniref:DUF7344 domain-containing protein n=1 Tax=Halosimplex salinum TaxID=1710538 RepID=UPI000F4A711F|nr:hypothetical protein [Halosimplex salinum]